MKYYNDKSVLCSIVVPMYIDVVPNRKSRPAILLRQGWREGKRVVKKTLANLSDWPAPKVEALRRVLKDEPLVRPGDLFHTLRTLPHGHVEALVGTLHKLGLPVLIGSKRTRQRDLVLAMITDRLIHHASKLVPTKVELVLWHSPSRPCGSPCGNPPQVGVAGLDRLQRTRHDLVLAMITDRLIHHASKLARL